MKKPNAYSEAVARRIVSLGFPTEFAEIVGGELHTEFTATWMLRYLSAAAPKTMEEIADEMLEILAFRDKCMEKHGLASGPFSG